MNSFPDKTSSNINIKQSEQRLDQELNNLTPIIGNVIQSLFNNEKTNQLFSSLPTKFDQILKTENIEEFDRLIENPLVQQLLNTFNADHNQIKKAVHMHNANIHQRLTAFQPIVNAIDNQNEHIIDEILSKPDDLITILYENSPELVTNFLTKKGFGKIQLENFLQQIPSKTSITKDELIKKLELNNLNGLMTKLENELKQSSIENFTLNDCLKQLTSTPNLQAFTTIINLLGEKIRKQT